MFAVKEYTRNCMSDRIEAIRKMLQNSQRDVFLHYSLAMELAAAGEHEAAGGEFVRCIELDSQYLPAYVEGGKCLRAAGKLQRARELFQQGMELATRLGNRHMRDFITQQLEGFAPSDSGNTFS
jgi:tetratricopeptide (TPR) repeat protein